MLSKGPKFERQYLQQVTHNHLQTQEEPTPLASSGTCTHIHTYTQTHIIKNKKLRFLSYFHVCLCNCVCYICAGSIEVKEGVRPLGLWVRQLWANNTEFRSSRKSNSALMPLSHLSNSPNYISYVKATLTLQLRKSQSHTKSLLFWNIFYRRKNTQTYIWIKNSIEEII